MSGWLVGWLVGWVAGRYLMGVRCDLKKKKMPPRVGGTFHAGRHHYFAWNVFSKPSVDCIGLVTQVSAGDQLECIFYRYLSVVTFFSRELYMSVARILPGKHVGNHPPCRADLKHT